MINISNRSIIITGVIAVCIMFGCFLYFLEKGLERTAAGVTVISPIYTASFPYTPETISKIKIILNKVATKYNGRIDDDSDIMTQFKQRPVTRKYLVFSKDDGHQTVLNMNNLLKRNILEVYIYPCYINYVTKDLISQFETLKQSNFVE